MYSVCRIWKKAIDNVSFFAFLLTLDVIWPKTTPTLFLFLLLLLLFCRFRWNLLGDSININNLCCNPVVLKKKIGKLACARKGSPWATAELQNNFFCKNNKGDHKFLKTFYIIKISDILGNLWIFVYFLGCFLTKKGSFKPKTTVAL